MIIIQYPTNLVNFYSTFNLQLNLKHLTVYPKLNKIQKEKIICLNTQPFTNILDLEIKLKSRLHIIIVE